jgi:hypothetical protein
MAPAAFRGRGAWLSIPPALQVQDATRQNVAWFHFRNDPGIALGRRATVMGENGLNVVRLPARPATRWIAWPKYCPFNLREFQASKLGEERGLVW